MTQDVTENLLEAMQIVAKYYYDDQKFDETIIATIIDDSDCRNGRYVVTNGTIKFDAYSDLQNYKNNDVVRVTILKGDYSEKKYIAGKAVDSKTQSAVTFISPSSSMLDMTGNLIRHESESPQWKLRAKYKEKSAVQEDKNADYEAIEIWTISTQDAVFQKLQQNNAYDSILLKADFKSLLSNYTSGHYGLWLDLYIPVVGLENSVIQKRFYLDSAQMFGDPYNFFIETLQEVKFNISPSEKIWKMSLYFYQDNNFIAKKNTIPPSLSEEVFDIFVSNIYISLGSDMSKVEDNKLVIQTQDNLLYNTDQTVTSNMKHLNLTWYNKNENGQYIGFTDGFIKKDGVSYKDYDEITDYLKEKASDDRLIKQQGQFNIPSYEKGLSLAADLNELEPLFTKVTKLIIEDLQTEFKNFSNKFDDESIFKDWLEKNDGYFSTTNELENAITDLVKEFKSALAYMAAAERVDYKLMQNSSIEQIIAADSSGAAVVYVRPAYTTISSYMNVIYDKHLQNTILYKLPHWLKELQLYIADEYPSLAGLCNNFISKINIISKKINDIAVRIKTISQRNFELGKHYYFPDIDALYNIIGKKFQDNSSIENDLNPWKPSSNYSEYDNLYCIYWYQYVDNYYDENDPIAEGNWQRIITDAPNIGLPMVDDNVIKEENMYYPLYGEQSVFTTVLTNKNSEERFKAVLIYNHEIFRSNEITFTNTKSLEKEMALNNIKISHGDNSKDAYPLYGVDNKLINAADYNRIRTLQIEYLTEEAQINNNSLINSTIYWYIPLNNTMLWYNEDECKKLGFVNYTYHNENDIRNGYMCFCKLISHSDEDVSAVKLEDLQFPYRIKDYFTPNNTNNTIYCIVEKEQVKYETYIDFTFSTFGSNGTNYSLVISPNSNKHGRPMTDIQHTSSFPFQINLYDYNNKQINLKQNTYSTEIKVVTPFDKHSFEEKSEGAEPQPLLYEITSNGTIIGEVPKLENDDYCILQAQVTIDNIQLKALYPISTIKEGYYIEGASTVIYDSYGSNPIYNKTPFKLFANDGKEEEDIVWEVQYQYKDNEGIKTVSPSDENFNKTQFGILTSYMPQLSDQNILLPSLMYLDEGNAQYLYPVVIGKKKKSEEELETYCIQPILLMQNRYPSAMLNNWDGSLQIDEINGTILSSLIGAGKRNSDNSFSGLLIGEIEAEASIAADGLNLQERTLAHNHTGIGLYGFHHGAQSFGFNVNGTAFIGKSGGGRIAFDGTQGFIYSSNWLNSPHPDPKDGTKDLGPFSKNDDGQWKLNPGSDGMAIDLQNGYIDACNFKLTSKGIKLNSSPDDTDIYYLEIGDLVNSTTPTATYIKYDKNGKLQMKVSSLEVIGSYGANNLLNNTEPLQKTVDTVKSGKEPTHDPTKDNINNEVTDKSAWTSYQRNEKSKQIYVWSALQGVGNDVQKCIGIDNVVDGPMKDERGNNMTTPYRYIYQTFDDSENKLEPGQYILTGYVWNNNYKKTSLKFQLGNCESSIYQLTTSGWNPIEIIFDLTTSQNSVFHIFDYSPNQDNYAATYLRELKLEPGSIATSWTSSEFDIEGYNKTIINTELQNFESKLNQEYIYSKLTNEKRAQGIYINSASKDGDNLYINANYITGIIGSLNENDGGVYFDIDNRTLTLKQSNSTYIQYSAGELLVGGLIHNGDFTISNGNLKIDDVTLTAQNLTDLLSLLDKGENGV